MIFITFKEEEIKKTLYSPINQSTNVLKKKKGKQKNKSVRLADELQLQII